MLFKCHCTRDTHQEGSMTHRWLGTRLGLVAAGVLVAVSTAGCERSSQPLEPAVAQVPNFAVENNQRAMVDTVVFDQCTE